MHFKKNPQYQDLANQITPRWAYASRREFIRAGSAGILGVWSAQLWALAAKEFKFRKNSTYQSVETPREMTKRDLVYKYNNFYEFSLDKTDVVDATKDWKIDRWSLKVEGLVEKPFTLSLPDLTSVFDLEERVYRFRCVEAWSMVVPWVGFPLVDALKRAGVKKEAKYVKFTSLADSSVMPNIKKLSRYPWPYTEGLTIAEAQNPLAFLGVGLYGEPLKNQNGAPVRLVVPWKYGFKSIKSIVKIELVKDRPVGLWEELAPSEYGFYANVNPSVDHPRWSQASERVIDGRIFPKRIPSLMFNGYAKEVASLYTGVDLKKNF